MLLVSIVPPTTTRATIIPVVDLAFKIFSSCSQISVSSCPFVCWWLVFQQVTSSVFMGGRGFCLSLQRMLLPCLATEYVFNRRCMKLWHLYLQMNSTIAKPMRTTLSGGSPPKPNFCKCWKIEDLWFLRRFYGGTSFSLTVITKSS
ncbi:hypothetical protein V6N13_103791 [Hibiscus sabdariffa]